MGKTKQKFAGWIILAGGLALLPLAANADDGYAAKDVHLRAGPARDYPVVAIVSAGTPMAVQGCLSGYSWCDVIVGGDRGWVYAGNIDYAYQGNNVAILNYGPAIGIGVLGFTLGAYWDQHYHDRSWYGSRSRWESRSRQHPIGNQGYQPQRSPQGQHPQDRPQVGPQGPRPQYRPPGGQQRPQDRPGGQHQDRPSGNQGRPQSGQGQRPQDRPSGQHQDRPQGQQGRPQSGQQGPEGRQNEQQGQVPRGRPDGGPQAQRP